MPTKIPQFAAVPYRREVGPVGGVKGIERRLFDIQIERMYSIGVSNGEGGESDVLEGTLDIRILLTPGASRGCAIGSRIEQVSGGRAGLNMGPAILGEQQG